MLLARRLLLCFLATTAVIAAADPAAARRPNFVLIMADDMGYGDLGCYGNGFVKTPNLDAMAAEGVRLTRFYSSPLCSPSRAAFLSGRWPSRYGCWEPQNDLPAEEVTMAELLRTAGYATGHFGKWHLGKLGATDATSPGGQGFATWFSIFNSYGVDKFNVSFVHDGTWAKTTGYCEAAIMDRAIAFVSDAAAKRQPFLAVVWNMAPHDPFMAPPADVALYGDRADENERRYWGQITAIDREIGRLRAELKRLGVADDTCLLFTSDNGGPGPSKKVSPLAGGKGTMLEGGLRVPTVVVWPARLQTPRTSAVPAGLCDLLPTVCSAAGVALPAGGRQLDGIDIMPLIDGTRQTRPSPIVEHFIGQSWRGSMHKPTYATQADKRGFAVITDRYKLLTSLDRSQTRLYDLIADEREQHDLAATKPEMVAELEALRATWWQSVLDDPAGAARQLPPEVRR